MTPVSDYTIDAGLVAGIRKWRSSVGIAGAIGVLLAIVGAFVDVTQFLHSYLWSYIFFLGVTLGCLALLQLQYVTGGAWGVMIRRIAEAVTRTLPLFVVLFLPIWIGVPKLYEWSHPQFMNADTVLKQKAKYLNLPFFTGRALLYFAGWLIIAYLLNRWSALQDETGDPVYRRKMESLSAFGLIFYCFSVTFMSIDWTMSLNPHWFSTMYGLLYIAGEGLSAFAFVIVMLVCLSHLPPLADVLNRRHLLDIGKLMFAFVMLFAYFSFS
jgi:hypothetical protein